jgi:opacity protein-like surface antigen
MKKVILASMLACGLATFVNSQASAVPIGASNESRDYIFSSGFPHFLKCGVFADETKRQVSLDDFEYTMDSRRMMVYAGADLLPWLSLYGAVGGADAELGDFETGDKAFAYEVGAQLSVLDHEILNPTLFEDRFRIYANGSFAQTSSDLYGDSTDWSEMSVSLIASIVNDLDGNKFFYPNSIGLYAGPVLSDIQGSDINEETLLGWVVGLQVFLTESVSLDAGIRQFEHTGFSGGVHLQF